MLMMVKAGRRRLSKKVLYRLAEHEIVGNLAKFTGEEGLIRDDEIVSWISENLNSRPMASQKIDFLSKLMEAAQREYGDLVDQLVRKTLGAKSPPVS